MTPDDWSHLPYFLAVARTGSLRLGAEQISATHATVDRHIKALEKLYSVRLFDRRPTGLALTDAGARLLPLAEAAEAAMTSARRKVSGLDQEAAGIVRVSLPPALALTIMPPILADFTRAHPRIELSVFCTNRFEDLTKADRDVSLRVAFSVDDDVVGRRLATYSIGIYASEDYLERHWHTRGAEGEGLHWIGWGETRKQPKWIRESPFPQAQRVHAMREGYLVAELAAAGMGMAYLPDFIMRDRPGMVRVPGTKSVPDRSIWLLLHADLRETTRVRLFVDHVAAAFAGMRPKFVA